MASLVLTDSSQLTADGFEKLPDQIMYPYAEPYDPQKICDPSKPSLQHRAVVLNSEAESRLPSNLQNPFYKDPRITAALAKESWFTPGEEQVREREAEKIPRSKIYSIIKNAGFVRRLIDLACFTSEKRYLVTATTYVASNAISFRTYEALVLCGGSVTMPANQLTHASRCARGELFRCKQTSDKCRWRGSDKCRWRGSDKCRWRGSDKCIWRGSDKCHWRRSDKEGATSVTGEGVINVAKEGAINVA
uniref:Uncharacterized protein n=1 Tax=Timema genevievae TaxID=629358 RepID=A0A7R9JRL6_TIMGE|nr:unnamed protein product [Timema genevievae]